MIDYGHTCLLIFAQGTWKERFKESFLKEITRNFISNMNIDATDLWNEIDKSPLFNPKQPTDRNKPCEVCHALYKIFEEKKGNNDRFILFSHNILGWTGLETFLLHILGQGNVKKVYFLELDQDSYTEGAHNKIPEIIKKIEYVKLNRTDFFRLFQAEKISFSTLYEVVKY
jgi:hypothetical protein